MRRICAIFRFINPSAAIRLAGGRILLDDGGKSCFESGANAAISGDMLTTTGETVMSDMQLIKSLAFYCRIVRRSQVIYTKMGKNILKRYLKVM